ncbi:MAG: MYXO-CTERM sorting domain-containing protein [Polyangiaceae bacterium]
MKLACAKLLVSVLAIFGVLVLTVSTASAAGSIAFSRTTIQESNGGWNLQMTLIYGGKPPMAHVPMRFSFTPTAFFERYLDDKHGDKPQSRTIPLVGQTPINESVDVGFGDASGKIFDRTKFDFTISRSHNFAAGEYDVIVRRADGAQVGAKVKLILQGENEVIDRRAISFVDSSKKKDGPKAAPAAAAPASEGTPAGEGTPAAAAESTPEPASSATAPEGEPGSDPTAAAKVPPGGSKGCGCRVVGDQEPSSAAAFAALGLVGVAFLRGRRRAFARQAR